MKTIILMLFLLSLSPSSFSRTIEQKNVNFEVKPTELFSGDLHYSFEMMPVRTLLKKYPELYDLDSLSLLQARDNFILLSKTVYITNKPIGFFDHELMSNEGFIKHIMGEQKIEKLGPHTFKVEIPGQEPASYKMKTYFDSDDITTLPNSRVIHAVSTMRKLDVMSQSSSLTVFKESMDFNIPVSGSINISSYTPLKENKTLVISYHLTGIKQKSMKDIEYKLGFLEEVEAVRKLTENYKLK